MKNISNQQSEVSSSRKINQKGFIEVIVVIIVALVLLNVIGVDLKAVLAKDSVRQFAQYVKDMIVLVWDDLKLIADFIKNMANNGN